MNCLKINKFKPSKVIIDLLPTQKSMELSAKCGKSWANAERTTIFKKPTNI